MGNNIVDMMEVLSGISLLCRGSEEDKMQAVFQAFDINGDGFISLDEMFKFLSSMFRIGLTPQVQGAMNEIGITTESPEELASVTAVACFKEADLSHDGRLSWDEFRKWFYDNGNDPAFMFHPLRGVA